MEFIIFMFHTTLVATICVSVLMSDKPMLWNTSITTVMLLSLPLANVRTGLGVSAEET